MSKASTNTIIATAVVTSLTALLYRRTQKSSSSKNTKKTYILAGDIGGTNTRLAIYSTDITSTSSITKPLFSKEYQNEKYITDPSKTFEHEIFLEYLSEVDLDWDSDINLVACFAVAGPVRDNAATMTNLGDYLVVLDGNAIESNNQGLLKYITKCKIVNDFVGLGYGLLDLDLDTEVEELIPGSKSRIDKFGPKACVGAGTGLGECYLTTSSLHPEEGYECYPSEGGHVDYAPRDDVQVNLLKHLKDKFKQKFRVSVERVVSGKGLSNIYEFLASEFPNKVRQDIQDQFENAGALQGKVVGESANSDDNPCPLCVQAMEIMMSAYGAEVGNCCLKYIPTGGLYVSGGLTPKNIKFIIGEDSPFMKAYKDKGRLSELVNSVPLFAVKVEDLGLRGARVCAFRVRFIII